MYLEEQYDAENEDISFKKSTAYLAADFGKGVSCSGSTMRLKDMKMFKEKAI